VKVSTWPVAWSDDLNGQTVAAALAIAGALSGGQVPA
jgi:hypothetical protein